MTEPDLSKKTQPHPQAPFLEITNMSISQKLWFVGGARSKDQIFTFLVISLEPFFLFLLTLCMKLIDHKRLRLINSVFKFDHRHTNI